MKKKTILLTLSACTLLVAGGMLFAKNGIKFNRLKADGDRPYSIVFDSNSVRNKSISGSYATFDLLGKTDVSKTDFSITGAYANGETNISVGDSSICSASGKQYETYFGFVVYLRNIGDQDVSLSLIGSFDGYEASLDYSYTDCAGFYDSEKDEISLTVFEIE